MGLVRHGVAQHAMKSRVRAYKNRAKGSGGQANWREHFCRSLTLKTSIFPLSIRLLFGPITSPTIKKSTCVSDLDSNQEVDGGQKPPDAACSNGEARERRLSAPLHCSLEAHSLLSSHFELIRHKLKDNYIVRFRPNTHSFSSSPPAPATFRSSR